MKKYYGIIAGLFFAASCLYSMPLHPDVVSRLKEEGKLQEVTKVYKEAQARGVNVPISEPRKWDFSKGKANQPVIVLLAEFSDNTASTSQAHYEDMLFSVGTYPTGSMRDYYLENSYGKLDITGAVSIWLLMPQTYAYYTNGSNGFGGYPRNAQKLVEDAVSAADPYIDFSQYDTDDDGYVDAIAVVHAGPGAEVTGDPNDIWSHMWSVPYPGFYVDGVRVYSYSMDPEDGQIGVFGHELGHVFGLPDLYDYDYDSRGLGYWSMMAAGSWGGGGAKPVHFDAWCKKELGFLEPIVINDYLFNAEIPQVETDSVVYKLWTLGTGTTQYFLVSNREKVGFDVSIPGEGLLIYHVDETIPNNDNQNHYKVALEQADGRKDLENNWNSGDAGDPFPGSSNNRTFDANTTPSSRDYDNQDTRIAVWNISNKDSLRTADLAVDYFMYIDLYSYSIIDTGAIEAGDTFGVICTLENQGALDADSVWAIMTSPDTSLNVLQGTVSFGAIEHASMASNDGSPFTVSVAPFSETHQAQLIFEIHAMPYDLVTYDTVALMVGRPPILIVDDDLGETYEGYYTEALDTLSILYDEWDMSSKGRIGDELQNYEIVIWFTGNDSLETLNEEDREDLAAYLDNEGKLFLTGQNIGQDISGTAFYEDYLHAQYAGNVPLDTVIDGVAGDAVGDSLSLVIISGDGADNQTSLDIITPLSGADSIFIYAADKIAGIKYESGDARIVYLGFGFEAINDYAPQRNKRVQVMERVIQWLQGGSGVEEVSSEISEKCHLQVSPNPFAQHTLITYNRENSFQPLCVNIYNVSGRFMRSLKLNPEGNAVWDGRDRNGKRLAAGIYFVILNDNFSPKESRKIILLQ